MHLIDESIKVAKATIAKNQFDNRREGSNRIMEIQKFMIGRVQRVSKSSNVI
jgi:ABC-type uncharacterized transport system ATPase subunit